MVFKLLSVSDDVCSFFKNKPKKKVLKKKKHFLDFCVFLSTTSRSHQKFLDQLGGVVGQLISRRTSYEDTEPPGVAGIAGEGKDCCTYMSGLSR